MKIIKFAVCDDEAWMRESLSARLSEYMKARSIPCQIDCFSSGREFLACADPFDLVFLDIFMKQPDGMETARILRGNGYQGLLIFITVLKESVFDAFEVQAYDYLVKPLEEQRFCRTMDRAIKSLERISGTDQKLFVKKSDSCEVIPFSQIVYCEVLGRKVYIHQQNGETIDYYDRLDSLEKRLDGRFFRCHRSYLVNLDYVRGCQNGLVRLSSSEEIPVSRLRRQELTQALLMHMKERRR